MKIKRQKLPMTVIILFLMVIIVGAGLVIFHNVTYGIQLKGEQDVTLNLCQVYEEQGATARKYGRDVSDQIKITSDLDIEKPGEYTVTYSVKEMTATRNITVLDKMDPIIELDGEKEMELLLGVEFVEPGYKATASSGVDLTDQVEVVLSNLNEAGERKITYTVSDGQKTSRITRDVTVLPNTNYSTPGLPICMYHYVYDEANPPEDLQKRYKNYIEQNDLKEEFAWLKAEGYYFPTWEEVRKYIDGELILPEKSIVLTFDDGAKSFMEFGVPVIAECGLPITSFLVTSWSGEEKVKQNVGGLITFQSHSHAMHKGGGSIGHGGIFTALSHDDALNDLKTSIAICGNGEAFAYPFGDYTQECRNIVEEAGFLCAVTTEYGKARPGMDPLLLPRIRMSVDQSLLQFQNMVAPW